MARVTIPLESPLDDPRYKSRVTRARNAYQRAGNDIWNAWNDPSTGGSAIRREKIHALRAEFGFGPFDFVNTSTCDRYEEYQERQQAIQDEYTAGESEMSAKVDQAGGEWVQAFADKRVKALGEEWRPFVEGILSLDVEGGGPREYMDEKIAIVEALPATPLMLDAVAREYNWCGVYARMKRKAREAGLLDVLRKLTGVPFNAAAQAKILDYGVGPEFARWMQDVEAQINVMRSPWDDLARKNYTDTLTVWRSWDVVSVVEQERGTLMRAWRSEHVIRPLVEQAPGLAVVFDNLTRYNTLNIRRLVHQAAFAHLMLKGANHETLVTLMSKICANDILEQIESENENTVRLDQIQAERGMA